MESQHEESKPTVKVKAEAHVHFENTEKGGACYPN
jgi:hypothetical protein